MAHSWGLQRAEGLKWQLQRICAVVDRHNMRALCVRAPDLEEAIPSELVRFFNRAGGWLVPALPALPARPPAPATLPTPPASLPACPPACPPALLCLSCQPACNVLPILPLCLPQMALKIKHACLLRPCRRGHP